LINKDTSIYCSFSQTPGNNGCKFFNSKFKSVYEDWIISNNYDLNKVKTITALIFLNMSPLHDEKFGKMLWFKCIEILSNVD